MSRWNQGALLAMLLPACAVDTASSDPPLEHELADQPVAAPDPAVLAEVQLDGDHRIRFVEHMPGAVTIGETGSVLKSPLLAKEGPNRLTDLYASLVAEPDPSVVAKLEQAQLRVDALNAQVVGLAAAGFGPEPIAPSAQEADSSADPSVDVGVVPQALLESITVNHVPVTPQFFEQLYCTADERGIAGEHCPLSTSASSTGWPGPTSWMRSIVVNAAPGIVTHRAFHYVCFSWVPLTNFCASQGWRLDATQTLPAPIFNGDMMSGYYVDTYPYTLYDASGGLHHMGALWSFL